MGIRAALIDLSGTLHVEKEAIPGAQAALRRLREARMKLRYVLGQNMSALHKLRLSRSNSIVVVSVRMCAGLSPTPPRRTSPTCTAT